MSSDSSSASSPVATPPAAKKTKSNSKGGLIPDESFFKVDPRKGLSPFQSFMAYLGGSMIQTVLDNPVTAYRQLIQQYAKNAAGQIVDPKVARQEANNVFKKAPISACLSGLGPRVIGVGIKRVPKFGFLWAITFVSGNEEPGYLAAVGASIFSAYAINPVRMIEKQQRINLNTTGKVKPVLEILQESRAKNFAPLFRGTVPLMGHSLASATTGLVGQPQLQKYIEKKLTDRSSDSLFTVSKSAANFIASSLVSPIYVLMTNPLSRLEVIMQTASVKGKSISLMEACKELVTDSKNFGLRGAFRGQGVGIFKAIISLSLFHEGRMFSETLMKKLN